MLVFDYRRPLNLTPRTQRSGIVERGPDSLAVEDYLALALNHVSSIAFPGGRGNSRRIAGPVPSHHPQRSHAQAHEGRFELVRGDAIFAQMRLVKIGPDLIERRPDVIRDLRQDLVALTDITHLRGALEPHRAERDS